MIVAILLVGGRGQRMDEEIPKQYLLLGGEPVFLRILRTLDSVDEITAHVCVVQDEWRQFVAEAVDAAQLSKPIHIATAGETRQASCRSGLVVAESIGAQIVVFMAAVRPFVSPQVLRDTLEAAKATGAAVAGVPVVDTIVRADTLRITDVLGRDQLWSIQSPEAFATSVITEAFEEAKRLNLQKIFAWELVHGLGEPVALVPSSYFNFKLTTAHDMLLAEACIAEQASQVSQDFAPQFRGPPSEEAR